MKIKKNTRKEQIDSIKNPTYTINPELDKYDDITLFPEKLRKAKEVIAKGNLPKEYYQQIARQKEEESKK